MIQLEHKERREEKIERLLEMVLERLDRIEKLLFSSGVEDAEIVSIASKLILAFSLPAFKAFEISSQIMKLIRKRKIDDISRTIIEILAVKGSTSISELTRNVKEVRGKASRRIVTERVRKLEKEGIVVIERRGPRLIVKLKSEENV